MMIQKERKKIFFVRDEPFPVFVSSNFTVPYFGWMQTTKKKLL